MSLFRDAFDPKVRLMQCACGRHASQAAHDAATEEALSERVVEQAVMRALFPRDDLRRRFLTAVEPNTWPLAFTNPWLLDMNGDGAWEAPGP